MRPETVRSIALEQHELNQRIDNIQPELETELTRQQLFTSLGERLLALPAYEEVEIEHGGPEGIPGVVRSIHCTLDAEEADKKPKLYLNVYAFYRRAEEGGAGPIESISTDWSASIETGDLIQNLDLDERLTRMQVDNKYYKGADRILGLLEESVAAAEEPHATAPAA